MKLHISLAKQDLAKCGGWQAIVLGMTELIRGLVSFGPISIQEESNLMRTSMLYPCGHCTLLGAAFSNTIPYSVFWVSLLFSSP